MNGFLDEFRAVVESIDGDSIGECFLYLVDFLFYVFDDASRVSTHDHHDHSDDCFTVTVPGDCALSKHGSELHIADFFESNGGPITAFQ